VAWLDLGTGAADGVPRSRDEWYRSQYLAGQAVTPYAAPLTARDLSGLPPAMILCAGLDPSVTTPDDTRGAWKTTGSPPPTWNTTAALALGISPNAARLRLARARRRLRERLQPSTEVSSHDH
jgi:acetyl esterase/lipase